MKKLVLIALCFSFLVGCKKDKTMEETPTVTSLDAKVQPVEFAVAKYTEMGKKITGVFIQRGYGCMDVKLCR
ncbi:hypothetical protein ACFX5E_15120 [Flavobacterium sp. LS2P90]|uniref:Uncharacterized protein n=1 Tax=Flavobacterium xylosi TaxID=3230415 RepID=A0ABW6HZE5_9FLAO